MGAEMSVIGMLSATSIVLFALLARSTNGRPSRAARGDDASVPFLWGDAGGADCVDGSAAGAGCGDGGGGGGD
jgi:hypothetical protein